MAQTTTTSSGTNIPSYMEDPLKKAIKGIESWTGSDANYVYGSKPGETLYTPLSDLQEESIGNIDWLANQDLGEMFGYNQAGDWISQFGNYDPSRLVDEGGDLGAISDYMNPYLAQVLDPAVANMRDQMQKNLNQVGAEAMTSGSFGGARHGIAEGEVYRDTNRDIGDLTARTMMGGYDNAMNQRAADRAAKMEANANKMTAASGISGLGNQFYDLFSNVNDSLFNAGEVEREAEMERNQALRNFQEAIKNKKYDDAMRIISAVQGTPYSTETTQTSQTKSNDGLLGLVGSALGALF